MHPIRAAIGATIINPDLLTCAERLQYEGYLRREETNAAVMALSNDGVSISRSSRRTATVADLSVKLPGATGPMSSGSGLSTLDAYLPWLDAQWAEGHRKGAELCVARRRARFHGSARVVVSEWATRRRRAEKAPDQSLGKPPSARTIARLMTIGARSLSKAIASLSLPSKAASRACRGARAVARFPPMIRTKD